MEALNSEELWGKVVYWDLRLAEAESAVRYAQEQKALFVGQLAVLEAQNES